MKHISLYIHIPFCVRKCLYCDFTSFPDKTDRIEDYLHRLECEMDEAVSRFGDLAVDTLFLGGGTPSLLGGDDMKRLMDAAAKRFSIAPGAEITCEANPGTLDPAKMRAYRAAGINRLSIGVQAFDDRL
ncbi:MAG: radical SAM protein, partial [Clostridiales bacterium]|nr:radical SAM protein [Clostridiales bacterium]